MGGTGQRSETHEAERILIAIEIDITDINGMALMTWH
jgi:hypothetical protein